MLRKYLKNHKYLLFFLLSLFIMGIILGIIFYNIMPEINRTSLTINLDNLKDQLINNHLNDVMIHFSMLVLISLLSLTVIGYLVALFYLFYLGMSIGFTLIFLLKKYALKGLIFSLSYNIIFKIIYIIILVLILIKLFDIVKNMIGIIIYKKNINLINNFRHNYLSILILIIINLGNDIFLSYTSTFILKIITSMI